MARKQAVAIPAMKSEKLMHRLPGRSGEAKMLNNANASIIARDLMLSGRRDAALKADFE